MIAIDLGCAEHGAADSIGYLVERFHPVLLFGFDPLLDQDEVRLVGPTRCVISRKAAWTYDGTLQLHRDGTASRVWEAPNGDTPCFDLATFIHDLPPDDLVLKLDVEHAEYPLLRHLRKKEMDDRLSLVLVEWHSPERVKLRCPMEEWLM